MAFLTTKTINNIKKPDSQIRGCRFFVKEYQRGYRWEPSEINRLLDDLNSFVSIQGSTYCLQPIVVKHLSSDENALNGRSLFDVINTLNSDNLASSCDITSSWELVDGQQRLTTLLLILNYCNKGLINPEPLPFEICYSQIRRVDNDYISAAMETIQKWFTSFDYEESQYVSKIKTTILQSIKIIWYEPDNIESSEIIFKKINVGKIRLTSAELFKAFLINEDNAFNANKKTQLEISYEWDQLEKNLCDDEFWYFISNQQRNGETGIDYLLSIYCQQIIGKIHNRTFSEEDDLFSYMVVSEYVAQHSDDPNIFINVWNDIKLIYSKLYSWFRDHELYHYVGFIIATSGKTSINTAKEIINLIKKTDGKTKSESRKIIIEEVKNRVAKIDLDTINYSDDRPKVFKVLLLFNLLTMIQSKTHARFPFMEFKDEKNKWDIEHIHSQANDEELKTRKNPAARNELLLNFKNQFVYLGLQSYADQVDLYMNECNGSVSEDRWIEIMHSVIEIFGNCDENGLGNLTLLSASINRGYHNALYPVKRKTIIEKDRGEEFIPVCTKNVFLKMYTDSPTPLMWNRDDAQGYLNAIKETFRVFQSE